MTSTAVIVDIQIKNLVPSRRNVRKSKPTKAEDAELLAGIRAKGMLQNLVVVQSKKVGVFEVIAGKRRLTAVQTLVKEGHFEDSQTVPCLLRSTADKDIEEIGTIENVQRVKMHPADEFEAFRKMQKNGQTPQDIALHLGISESTVYKRLKLAAVDPRIIKAYRNNELAIEAVMAFTVEDDKAKQMEVFVALQENNELIAYRIRSSLKDDDIETSKGRLGRFVGLTAYEKAGGTFSSDLFQEVVYFNDRDILTTLAIEKLTRASKKLSDSWNWIEITLDRSNPNLKMITGHHTADTQALADKANAIGNKIESLNSMDMDYWEEKHTDQERRLLLQLDRAEDAVAASLAYNPEQKALAGCIVSIDENGQLYTEQGLVRKSDEKTLDKLLNPNGSNNQSTPKDTTDSQPTTKEPAQENQNFSQALLDDLATYRTNIAKRFLAENTDAARDVLYYTVIVSAFTDFWYNSPLELRTAETRREQSLAKPDSGKAPTEMVENHKNLELDWLGLENEADRFCRFSELSKASKDALMAFAVAQSLHGQLSNQNGMSNSLMENIYTRLDIPWHSYFKPTAENYLVRISKTALITLGAQFLNEEWVERAEKRSKREVAIDLEDLFSGDNSYLTITDEKRAEAIDWIPEGFRPATEEPQS